MIKNQDTAQQAVQDWWDKDTPDEWKKHYKEILDDYLVTRKKAPDEVAPSKNLCKELIPYFGVFITEWRSFDVDNFSTAYKAHKELYNTVYNHLGSPCTEKLR